MHDLYSGGDTSTNVGFMGYNVYCCLAAPSATPGCISHWLWWSDSDSMDVIIQILILKAGGLVIRRSLVRILTELHVEVSLSKILNPKVSPDVQLAPCVAATAISKGAVMSWRLIQGVPWPSPIK